MQRYLRIAFLLCTLGFVPAVVPLISPAYDFYPGIKIAAGIFNCSLGYSGIGGKTSSGFGAFHLDDLVYLDAPFADETEWLSSALHTDADRNLLLTSCLPAERELDAVIPSASYQLVRRGGFVQSDSYAAAPQKKQTQYFLSSGAVVGKRFSGGLFDVGQHGNHPVYRYSRPSFLGVDL